MNKIRFLPLGATLIALAVPFVLVLGSVRLVMTETYLRLEYHKPDFPTDTYGFTLDDRLYYAPFAAQYLLNGAGIDYLRALKKPDGSPLYTEIELKHMVDVKLVAQGAGLILAGTLILLIAMTLVLGHSSLGRRVWQRGMVSGATLTLVLLAGLALYVILDWDRFFASFHNLFFSEGSWQFDYADSLIRLYPIRFWQDTALTVGALSAIGAVLAIGFVWWQGHRDRG